MLLTGIWKLGGYHMGGKPAVIIVISYIFFMIAAWRIFEKAGECGWKALIPIWNVYILYKITWGYGLLFLLGLIPFVGLIMVIVTDYKLAKVFGHGLGFTLGLIFFPWIFWLILGFGASTYHRY